MNVTIDMERNFLLDDNNCWNWHKSWNLPNISITLDVHLHIYLTIVVIVERQRIWKIAPAASQYLRTKNTLEINIIQAKIYAAKKESGELLDCSNTVLSDVGLKGNEEKPLVNCYCIFSGLKFKTTSYNHEGTPFYLVISLYYGS